MRNVYDQHRAAFANVSAYVVVKDGKRVASIAFKFPRHGAGRLWCYLHIFGAPMARGYAGGYGYDKRTAALEAAARNHSIDAYPEDLANIQAIKGCFSTDSGQDFDSRLRAAGFEVWQAV